jgi:hypothetical protein
LGHVECPWATWSTTLTGFPRTTFSFVASFCSFCWSAGHICVRHCRRQRVEVGGAPQRGAVFSTDRDRQDHPGRMQRGVYGGRRQGQDRRHRQELLGGGAPSCATRACLWRKAARRQDNHIAGRFARSLSISALASAVHFHFFSHFTFSLPPSHFHFHILAFTLTSTFTSAHTSTVASAP